MSESQYIETDVAPLTPCTVPGFAAALTTGCDAQDTPMSVWYPVNPPASPELLPSPLAPEPPSDAEPESDPEFSLGPGAVVGGVVDPGWVSPDSQTTCGVCLSSNST